MYIDKANNSFQTGPGGPQHFVKACAGMCFIIFMNAFLVIRPAG
jgi:hypothetical protein